jgi:SAM-dependent methyltransferase
VSSDEMAVAPHAFFEGGMAVESYELFTAQAGPLAGDVEFYVALARAQGGPVLEVACGSGRVLLPLARAGVDATGLDISPAMIEITARRLAEEGLSARLVCASMNELDLDRRFSLILIPWRAFQHLTEPAEQRQTLERLRDHLRSGGRLVLDLFDPRLEACVGVQPTPMPREVVDGASGRRFRRISVERTTDPFCQVCGERLRIEELDVDGKVIGVQETSWTLRWATRQEMAYLLELSGFEVEALYSNFDRAPPAYGAEQIWVARKP